MGGGEGRVEGMGDGKVGRWVEVREKWRRWEVGRGETGGGEGRVRGVGGGKWGDGWR